MENDNKQLIRVSVRRGSSKNEEIPPLALEVSRSQTVGETKKMLHELDSSVAVEDLTFDGQKVDDDRILGSFPESGEEALIFIAERRTLEVRTDKKRRRCSFSKCNSVPLRGVGDCQNCNGHFCSRHRLMEQHQCAGLQCCKQQLHERNALRLQQQQTVSHKV